MSEMDKMCKQEAELSCEEKLAAAEEKIKMAGEAHALLEEALRGILPEFVAPYDYGALRTADILLEEVSK